MANYYNPYPYSYYPPVQQMPQQQVPQQMQQPVQQQMQQPVIQNGGFISVRNETEARNYPVAPGNSITFKDETAPYVYTKTMGFSQLDRPIFDKYKLVKEETSETVETTVPQTANPNYENEINNLKTEMDRMWGEINALKEPKPEPKPARQKTSSKEDKDGGDD